MSDKSACSQLPLGPLPAQSRELGQPGSLHKLGASVLVALVCGLEVRAILGPHEDWPFTSAPMFARYHAPGQPLYELTLLVERGDGTEFILNAKRDLGLGELGFKRQFFARYYGSTDARHPGGHHVNDSPERFQARLLLWMRRTTAAYTAKHGHAPFALKLEVRRLLDGSMERRAVARFVPAEQSLTLMGSTASIEEVP